MAPVWALAGLTSPQPLFGGSRSDCGGGATAASTLPAPRTKGRLAFLTTTAGVAGLTALLVVGSAVAYFVTQSSANTVGVVLVRVTITTSGIDAPAEFTENSLQLNHCSQASFSASERRLTLTGAQAGASVRNVVIVEYTGAIFSFFGGNALVTLLDEGQETDIVAAFHQPTVLYTLAPGTRMPFIPGREDQVSPLLVESTYTVGSQGNFTPRQFVPPGMNLSVTEVHHIESYGGVRVVNNGQSFCM